MADEVVTLVEETGITAEVAVCKGAMVQKPTSPTKMGIKFGAGVRTVGKEVGRRRKNDGLRCGEKIFVRPCHQGAHSEASHRQSQDIREACHRGAHSKVKPSGAYYDQPRSLTIKISSNKIFLEG